MTAGTHRAQLGGDFGVIRLTLPREALQQPARLINDRDAAAVGVDLLAAALGQDAASELDRAVRDLRVDALGLQHVGHRGREHGDALAVERVVRAAVVLDEGAVEFLKCVWEPAARGGGGG